MSIKLITIPSSHFCERARWALQRYSIEFEEEMHPPGFHRSYVLKAGGKGSTPCLVVDHQVYDDSELILKWIDQEARKKSDNADQLPLLYDLPEPEDVKSVDLWSIIETNEYDEKVLFESATIASLNQLFCERLGPDARFCGYSTALKSNTIGDVLMYGAVGWERFGIGIIGSWPFTRLISSRGGFTEENTEEALKRIEIVFTAVEKLLAQGSGEFLLGDKFSCADLTFVALAAPVLGIRYTNAFPEEPNEYLAPIVAKFSQTSAGKYALKLWEQERQKRL